MSPKPQHLTDVNAAAFQDPSVVEAYHHRATYPSETSDVLLSLLAPRMPNVLDVGTGTGDLARPLSAQVAVDAVDPSEAMLATGRQLAGSDSAQLRWIHGRIEDVVLDPPYGLVTAGQSLHWMDWNIVMPLFRRVLVPGGVVAIVDIATISADPWNQQVGELVRRFSVVQDYRPYDLVSELEQRNLFRRTGMQRTAPAPYTPTVDSFIESFHARSSLARTRMGSANAASFDTALREVLTPYAQAGRLESQVVGTVDWGEPSG